MASIDGEVLGGVKATRRALGLPALTVGNALKSLTGIAGNKKDAERQRNIDAMVAQLQDADPSNDAAAMQALQGAATSWAGGGKEMAANALRSLQGGAAPQMAGALPGAGPGIAAPAAAGGGLLDSVGGALRRLNGGRALTAGNLLGGAAKNVGGALGGIGGAVGGLLGGAGGFVRDHAGELAGAGVAALGIPEMQRANRLREQALGAVPEDAALGLPGSLDVDGGAAINPADSARLDRYRSLTDQSLEGLQGPSRTELAQSALADFDTAQGRAGDAAFRRATQLAAAKGGLGSGMLTSSYGDVATQLQEQALAKRNELASGLAEGDISDRFRRLDVTNSLVGQQAGTEAGQRGELRGERGYAAGVQEGNINRRLGAASDAFGRGVTRAGVRSDFANAADQRAGALMGAGADLAAGAAQRRAYGQAANAAGIAGGLPGYGAAQVGAAMAAAPVSAAVDAMRPLGIAAAPAVQPFAAPRVAPQVAAPTAPPGAMPAALPQAVAAPHVQPLINAQIPLPPAGPASVAQPKPITPVAPTLPKTRRRLTAVAGGL